MTPKQECPRLADLAQHAMNGACNPYALIHALADALVEINPHEVKEHPAVRIVVGQISYLLGETLGPSDTAIKEYQQWTQN